MKKIYSYDNVKVEILFRKPTKIQRILRYFSSKRHPTEYFLSLPKSPRYIPRKIGEDFSQMLQGPLEISCLFRVDELFPQKKQVYTNSPRSCSSCPKSHSRCEKLEQIEIISQENTLRLTSDYMLSKEKTAPKEPTHTFYKVMRTLNF
jgi:hypothetical protein